MSVYVSVENLWRYFQDNVVDLRNKYHQIADEPDDGVTVYVTSGKNFYPEFLVDVSGITEYEAGSASKETAEAVYKMILNAYVASVDEPMVYNEALDPECLDRVDEIVGATEDLLHVLLECDPRKFGLSTRDIEEIAAVVESVLFDEHEFSVYHPMIEDGQVVKYPFSRIKDLNPPYPPDEDEIL